MRKTIFNLHLYSALVTGLVLCVLGLTGAILAFEEDIDSALNPHLFRVHPAEKLLPIADVQQKMAAQYPATKGVGLRLPPNPEGNYMLQAGQTQYFVNPYTAELAGVRQLPTAFTSIHGLHGKLLVGPTGAEISRVAASVLLFLVASGLYLWWPYRRRSVSLRGSLRRASFDAHLAVGLYASSVFAILGLTGVLVAQNFQLGAKLVSDVGKTKPARRDVPSEMRDGAQPVPAEDAIASARLAIPGARPTVLFSPKNERASYLILMRQPDDRNVGGRSWVNVDQYSGKAINVVTWRDAPPTARMKDLTRAIHTGDIFGYPSKLVASSASLLLVLQMITGAYLWLRKLRARSQ